MIRTLILASVTVGTLAGAMWTRSAHHATPADTMLRCGGSELTPQVLFCDDFEGADYQRQWNISAHDGRWPISDFVQCWNKTFGFRSSCAAWSNFLTFDHEWGFWGFDARHPFPERQEFYVRWYQYVSDPFEWGPLEDKSVMLHDKAETIVAYVGTSRTQQPSYPNSGPGVPFVANYQDVDTPETNNQYTLVNRFQNKGKKFALQPGRWYLFEWYLKLNTPGKSDGATKLWIDDATQPIAQQTLRMSYDDMRWLKQKDAGKAFGLVRLTVYHQRCDIGRVECPPKGPELLAQSHRWDRLVISTAPVGPVR